MASRTCSALWLLVLLAWRPVFLSPRADIRGRCRQSKAISARAMSNDDLKVLQSRIEEIKQRPTLPIIMVDSMLPGQRLVFRANNEELADLAEEGLVGVLGQPSRRPTPAVVGVTAKLTSRGLYEWELKAERVFQVISQPELEGKITRAKVEFLDEPVSEDDIQLAEAIPVLVDEWQQALLEHKAERYEGQLKDILKDLGEMPSTIDANRLAFWAAALVNPLPALGVALEIRPAVLEAPSVKERIQIVRQGLRGSIEHISGRKRLF
ncbi:Uncharacterized protein SCF082_LOCUS33736 [Durusdinium trenchii]|uniref:Lon N-terminal domain-containing protein n=1 Tax=Durusdinium trenchii TaxID=1381693 RepID=A0ABP0NS13_9DINO